MDLTPTAYGLSPPILYPIGSHVGSAPGIRFASGSMETTTASTTLAIGDAFSTGSTDSR
jgi:hypothetical protein